MSMNISILSNIINSTFSSCVFNETTQCLGALYLKTNVIRDRTETCMNRFISTMMLGLKGATVEILLSFITDLKHIKLCLHSKI